MVTKIPADLTCIKVNCFTSSILQVGKYSNRNWQKCLSEIGLMSVHLSTYKFFLFITTHYTILSGRDFHFVIVILSLWQEHLGDLLISMMYQPTNNRIVVVVMKASKLKKMDFIGSCGEKKYNNYDPRWSSFSLNQKKLLGPLHSSLWKTVLEKSHLRVLLFWAVFVKYYPKPHMLIGFCDVRLDYNSHLVSGGTKVHLLNCSGETDF